MTSDKVNQLQLLQQNLHSISMQKQQIESQLTELNSALTEIKTTDKSYKILGKMMIAASKEDLSKDLQEKKDVAEIHLKNFASQEDKLKEQMESLQKEVMKELQEENNDEQTTSD